MSDIIVQHRLGLIALMTVVWAVCMGIEAGLFDKQREPVLRRFESPVASLELAETPAGSWRSREEMKLMSIMIPI